MRHFRRRPVRSVSLHTLSPGAKPTSGTELWQDQFWTLHLFRHKTCYYRGLERLKGIHSGQLLIVSIFQNIISIVSIFLFESFPCRTTQSSPPPETCAVVRPRTISLVSCFPLLPLLNVPMLRSDMHLPYSKIYKDFFYGRVLREIAVFEHVTAMSRVPAVPLAHLQPGPRHGECRPGASRQVPPSHPKRGGPGHCANRDIRLNRYSPGQTGTVPAVW